MEKKTPDPEQLTPEERRAVLERARRRAWRDAENLVIARELAREAKEAERQRSES
jgi:hypothetical protein